MATYHCPDGSMARNAPYTEDVTCADVKQEFTMPNSPPPLLSLVTESVDIKVEPSSPETVLPLNMTCDDIEEEISLVTDCVDIKVEPASATTMLATERLDMIDREPSESSALQPRSIVVTPLTDSAEISSEVSSMESNLRIPGCAPAVPATLGEQFQQVNPSGHQRTYEVKFQCSQCSAMLANKWSLQKHMLTHSSERPYECDMCGTRFKRKGALVKHHITHTNEKEFKCELCPSEFHRKASLERHKKLHERGEDLFPCQECGRIFRQNESLLKHLRRHTLEKPFACHLCPAKFPRQPDLNVHMRKHTGERPYKCSICEKSFSQSHTRTIHMRRMHTEVMLNKGFSCSACGKVYFHRLSLRRHEGTHEIKIFQCSLCSVTVARRSLLNSHMLTHSSERPHKCGTCGMGFKRRAELLRHRSTHTVEKKFKCELCPSAFRKKLSLKRHKEFHERGVDMYNCQECGKTFLYKKNLLVHLRQHMLERPFACPLCPAKFSRENHWETHMRGHTDKKT
ncbi:hypothetical protein HPB51_004578 [Rhipicephalus microplus]|uniref:C2H2-type domain-containing protein n=1 Tax=Rhipicephalus microplus TaxID=6941 RepID=A0A9J6ELH7_RHIMP|nr:hypothetical protein HPB51_004578 [Rhipicephalus microplus]